MAPRKRVFFFFNLLQKEGVPRKGVEGSLRKGWVPTLEETMGGLLYVALAYVDFTN